MMNIILFCRILSVDFSGVFITSYNSEKSENCTTGHSRAIGYVRSLFQEEGTKRRVVD
jgi:hypothetical protein